MKNIRSKLIGFGTGLMTTLASLFPAKEVASQENFYGKFGIGLFSPEDKYLKDEFGSLFGIKIEAGKEMKDFRLGPQLSHYWKGKRDTEKGRLGATYMGLVVDWAPKINGNELFFIGGGPAYGNISLNYEGTSQTANLPKMEKESEGGLGLIARAGLNFPFGKKKEVSLFIDGAYILLDKEINGYHTHLGGTSFNAGLRGNF